MLIGVEPDGGYEPMSLGLSRAAFFPHNAAKGEFGGGGPAPYNPELVNPSRARSKKAWNPGGQM